MLWEIGKKNVYLSVSSLCVSKLEIIIIFFEMFCANLQSPVGSRHVCRAFRSTIAVGKFWN